MEPSQLQEDLDVPLRYQYAPTHLAMDIARGASMSQTDLRQQAEESFVAFTRACLSRLRMYGAAEGVSLRVDSSVTFGDGGLWMENAIVVPDYARLLAHHWDTLCQLPEAAACVRSHYNGRLIRITLFDPQGHQIADPPEDQAQLAYLQQLYSPLHGAIRHHHALDLTREQIVDIYRMFRDHTWAGTQRDVVTIPLFSMTGDLQEDVSITPAVRIGPFTATEKAHVWTTGQHMSMGYVWSPDASMFGRAQYRLSGVDARGDQEAPPSLAVYADIGHVITALRLLKSGTVGAAILYRHADVALPGLLGGGAQMLDYHVPWPFYTAPSYFVAASDIDDIRRLVDALRHSRVQHELSVPLRRFNQSYSRSQPEDRIIDLAIVLESTLLAKMPDELSFRLAVYGATMLADQLPPHDIRNVLRAMYDVRSNIVHEGRGIPYGRVIRQIPADQIPQRAEELTRAILRAYVIRITAGQSIKSINAQLEEDLMNGLVALHRPATQ